MLLSEKSNSVSQYYQLENRIMESLQSLFKPQHLVLLIPTAATPKVIPIIALNLVTIMVVSSQLCKFLFHHKSALLPPPRNHKFIRKSGSFLTFLTTPLHQEVADVYLLANPFLGLVILSLHQTIHMPLTLLIQPLLNVLSPSFRLMLPLESVPPFLLQRL